MREISSAPHVTRRGFLGAVSSIAAAVAARPASAQRNPPRLTSAPPLGWNSFDCFTGRENEQSLMENLSAFAKKLKPHGYQYFVLDGVWFSKTGGLDSGGLYLDGYGRPVPSPSRFPRGLGPVIERAHALGVKFGIWMVRGVPKQAVDGDLPVKGTKYGAASIANKQDVSTWYRDNYGVNIAKAAAQQYYNSLVEPLAAWGVDFIKWDDIVPHPDEIEAAANAVATCGRDIVLSLSPGDEIRIADMPAYRRASMLRITGDVWDTVKDLDKGFARWEMLQDYGGDGFWLDLDMIPFGDLSNRKDASHPFRKDNFTTEQKRAFLAQRALAASPLFMGGNLPTSDELSMQLVTHSGMLACDQNGVVGKLVSRTPPIEVWKTPHRTKKNQGWLGVFNRSSEKQFVSLETLNLGIDKGGSWRVEEVWRGAPLRDGLGSSLDVSPQGVAFLRYEPK